ncbi:MAG TPA: hypothetical protein PKA90_16665 [Ignavibacteria bacterium]|nr:hypothetical protein [Ignavibacteria bacterium]HMQ70607.1 hypothetical protein [Ignavibacteria bacterium]HMR42050.1 hypothetical protein [Ignavibacteria bacterium]
MKRIKLFILLKSLSKQEFEELYDFIISPAINKDPNLTSLYNYVKTNYEAVISGDMSKEELFKEVMQTGEFNETKYWKLTSGLSKLIDKFLMYREYEKDIYYQKNLLLDIYRTRNVPKLFETHSKEIRKSFDSEFNKGLSFYFNRTHYYFQKLSYLGDENIDEFEVDLKKMFEDLRMFFIMTNITSISIISNFKDGFIKEAKKDIWMFDGILEFLTKNKTRIKKENHIVYIFFLIILIKLDPSKEKYYFEIKERLQTDKYRFSKNLLRHILINLFDYAVKKFVSGDEKFLKEIYFINKILDGNSLTLFGEFIQGGYFYSVVEHSALLGELVWAEEFIGKYGQYLNEDYRESGLNLAKARVFFELGDFDSSLMYLIKVDNLDHYFYLSHKVLLLQNYYEKKDFESIERVLETTKKYLNRRIDISDELKNNFQKFFHFFRKLKTTANGKEYLSKNLHNELSGDKFFIYRKWLLDKTKEMRQ